MAFTHEKIAMPAMSSPSGRRAQVRGFTLIEVGIAATLSAMLMSGALMFISDYLKGQAAQAQGQELFAINTAVNQYEAKYASQIGNSQPIAIPGHGNVANIYSPSLTELFELGMLANATPAGNYGIQISPTLVGGVPSGLTWISMPFLTNSGKTDQVLAGTAMLAAGGDAGISTVINPGMIVGSNGWTATNPVAGTPVGILAMRNGAGSGAYVRLDGSTPMQGSLNLNGNSLTNASTVGATTVNATTTNATTVNASTTNTGALYASSNVAANGNVTAGASIWANGNIGASGNTSGSTLTATAGGNDVYFGSSALYSDGWNSVVRNTGGALYVQNFGGGLEPTVTSQLVTPAGNGVQVGSAYYYGDSWNSAVRQNGTFYVQNLGGGSADINTNNVVTSGYVQVGGYASAGWGCGPNGSIATNGSGPLFCVNGVWTAMGGTPTSHISQYALPGGAQGTWDVGWHNYCAISQYDTYQNTVPEIFPVSGANSTGQYDWNMSTCNTGSGCDGGSYGTWFTCWDFN